MTFQELSKWHLYRNGIPLVFHLGRIDESKGSLFTRIEKRMLVAGECPQQSKFVKGAIVFHQAQPNVNVDNLTVGRTPLCMRKDFYLQLCMYCTVGTSLPYQNNSTLYTKKDGGNPPSIKDLVGRLRSGRNGHATSPWCHQTTPMRTFLHHSDTLTKEDCMHSGLC